MWNNSSPIDLITVTQYLAENHILDRVGGASFVTELFTFVPSPVNIEYYLGIVHDKFLLRQIIVNATEIVRQAYVGDETPDTIISDLAKRTESIVALSGDRIGKSTLSVRRFSELVQMTFDDTDNFFGDRVIAAGQPCTLLGPGGVGKSRLSLQLAVCMITGREFLGMPTLARNKRWLFIQTENSNRRLHFDLKNMVAALELSPPEIETLEDTLIIHTLETDADALLNLFSQETSISIKKLIHQIDPDFVQWDPLNSLTDQDLNSDMDMRALVTQISIMTQSGRHDRVPLVLHHSLTGKAGAARAVGWDKSSYGRNSKVLQAWTRSQMNLSPRSGEDTDLLLLSCGKNNNGRLFPEIGVIFNDESGIYVKDDSFNPEDFRAEVGLEGPKKRSVEPRDVALEIQPGIPSARLADRIIQRFQTSRSTAYRAIEAAKIEGLIREEMKNFKPIYFLIP
jgi:hypothetical protein